MNDKQKKVLENYRNAATLNQVQIADYMRLLELEKKELAPKVVTKPKKRGRKSKKSL